MHTWIIIPTFNEEKTIEIVIQNLIKFISNIIVVNDCSTDNTIKLIKKYPVKIINNNKNLGYTKSLEAGIELALRKKADYVIFSDADGEHKASDIKRFLSIIETRKPDIILGKRNRYNRFIEYLVGFYTKYKYKISDPFCGLKAINCKIIDNNGLLETKYTIGTEIIIRAIKDGAPFEEIDIQVETRHDKSRFGNKISGNMKELYAFINILFI